MISHQNLLNLVLRGVGLRLDGRVQRRVAEEEDADDQEEPPELDPPAVSGRISVLVLLQQEAVQPLQL